MAEWSIASVLKTDEGHTSGGFESSLSANTLTLNSRKNFSLARSLWM